MLDIQWTDKHMRESGFYHIFSHFKRFYLPRIFSQWDPVDRIYKETKGNIHHSVVTTIIFYAACFLTSVLVNSTNRIFS